MKTIRSNAEQVLKSDYNEYADKSQSFKDYVELCSQSDPNFFSWLFDEELGSDFDTDLTEEHRESFSDFLKSLQASKEDLIKFCGTQDYAFAAGAGIMYANDDQTRQGVLENLNADGVMIEMVGLEGPANELREEAENGCDIYKVWKSNQEPMYIAYYE